ncbi:hypothetical protein [Salinispora arenicola]|uniref:hypothetical protein n=1 Tax=Salinispora arenicola TaxID=168697 RepID=UPI00147770F8|nr:hypothetical protein [Salinispora arenicola]
MEDDEGSGDDLADAPGVEADVAGAMKVVFRRLLPRSPTARSRLWAWLNCCLARVSPPLGSFERDDDGVGFALVAEVGQGA